MTEPIADPRSLLGLTPTAEPLSDCLKQLASLTASKRLPSPEIKSYPDALYKNYYSLGLSLMFVDKDGSKAIKDIDPQSEKLVLDSIDIYNAESIDAQSGSNTTAAPKSNQSYSSYPALSLALALQPGTMVKDKPRPNELVLTPSSTGKDILIALGEPDRKGGGAGPSSGSINIWCEWSKDGIMIEFGGPDAKGPHAWDRGKDAKWRILTLFQPKSS